MRTGEVAAAAGVNVQTLRYYERRVRHDAKEELPGPAPRPPCGHALDDPAAGVAKRKASVRTRLARGQRRV